MGKRRSGTNRMGRVLLRSVELRQSLPRLLAGKGSGRASGLSHKELFIARHLWSEPIKQSHLPCEHGAATLSPESMKAVKRVSLHTWTQLLKYAGGSDVVFSSKGKLSYKCCLFAFTTDI